VLVTDSGDSSTGRMDSQISEGRLQDVPFHAPIKAIQIWLSIHPSHRWKHFWATWNMESKTCLQRRSCSSPVRVLVSDYFDENGTGKDVMQTCHITPAPRLLRQIDLRHRDHKR